MTDKNEASRYTLIESQLQRRLAERPPTRIQFLIGPRQVGKTTLLLSLARGLKGRALYASADAPEAALPSWGDRIWNQAVELAREGPAVLFLDEIQYLPNWSQWLKARFDVVQKEALRLHVVATGSSSLHVGHGAKETMAGRFERLTLTHWSCADLTGLLGVPADLAPQRIVTHGGYPGAVALWDEPLRWQAYLRDAIIDPAIGRDILQLEVVRKPALLRQLFALAAAHPAEILSLEKIAGLLTGKGSLETVSHYLDLLREAYLVVGLQKLAGDEIRRRRSPPKLLVLNNALIAGLRTEAPPDPVGSPAQWGRWVENACLAHAWNSDQEVFYWREEPWEVDGVIQGSWGRWLIEVKTGDYAASELRGLAEAARRFPAFRPLVLCDPNRETVAATAGMNAMPWTHFLQHGLRGERASPRDAFQPG